MRNKSVRKRIAGQCEFVRYINNTQLKCLLTNPSRKEAIREVEGYTIAARIFTSRLETTSFTRRTDGSGIEQVIHTVLEVAETQLEVAVTARRNSRRNSRRQEARRSHGNAYRDTMPAVSPAPNSALGRLVRDLPPQVPGDEVLEDPEPRAVTPHSLVAPPAEVETALVTARAPASSHSETPHGEEETANPRDDHLFEAVYPTGTIRQLLATDFYEATNGHISPSKVSAMDQMLPSVTARIYDDLPANYISQDLAVGLNLRIKAPVEDRDISLMNSRGVEEMQMVGYVKFMWIDGAMPGFVVRCSVTPRNVLPDASLVFGRPFIERRDYARRKRSGAPRDDDV